MNGKVEFVISNNLLELDLVIKFKGMCFIFGYINSFFVLFGKVKDSFNVMVFLLFVICG